VTGDKDFLELEGSAVHIVTAMEFVEALLDLSQGVPEQNTGPTSSGA
jgi:hypothetical protein